MSVPRPEPARRPLWSITSNENGRMEVLTIAVCDGERAVPVFSFTEESELFLGFEPLDGEGWRVRYASTGELASLLCGPCVDIREVALDPLLPS